MGKKSKKPLPPQKNTEEEISEPCIYPESEPPKKPTFSEELIKSLYTFIVFFVGLLVSLKAMKWYENQIASEQMNSTATNIPTNEL